MNEQQVVRETIPPAPWSGRQKAAALAGLVMLFLFFSGYYLSSVPLLDPDEPRYAAGGRTMAEGGSWLIPYFNGSPRVNKPPLFYWLVALSARVCGGSSEAGARLPSIVMGLAMLLLTVWLGARLYDAATGCLGGLILCTTPLFIALSRTCVIDQTFSTLVAAALACLLLGVVDRWPSRAVSPVVACGLLTGLAFMAKGTPSVLVLVVPLAFVLLFARRELRASPARLLAGALLVAGLAGLGYALWKKLQAQGIWAAGPTPMPAWAVAALALAALISLYVGLRSYWVRAPWGLALLAALLLAAWWYVFLWVKLGTAEFGKMVEYELAGRLAGQMHRQAVYYYLLAFPALFFPWSPALLSALGCAWTKVTAGLPLHSIRKEGPTPEELRAVSDPFLAAWVVGTVAFFSIPGAKLGSYILPAFPAAALLTARFLLKLRRSAEPVGTGWRLLPPIFAGLVALGLVLLPAQVHRLPREAQEAISQLPVPLWLISGMLILFMCAPWFRACLSRRPSAAALPLAFSMAVLWALAVPTALARFQFKATNRDLSRNPEVARRAAEAASIYTVGWEEEGLVYYLRRTVREVRKPDAAMKETMGAVIREALASQPPGRILMFAHKRKLEKWLGRPLPPDARPIAENSYVVVLVNEPER